MGSQGVRRGLLLVVGLAAIVVWQHAFFRHGGPDTTLASSLRLEASIGVTEWQPEFVYFLYYLDLYPVASISTSPREWSVEGARRLIAERGHTLVMDRYWTIRYGDLAKTYLYLPHVWLKGRPVKPRMLHANALGFTLALLALFAAFWHVGHTALGAVLVVLMGSNPFQVNEVYANNNVLGWPITITLLMLALHVPLMKNAWPPGRAVIALAIASGLLLGTMRQVRTEPVLVLVAVAGVYLTATRLRLRLRLVLVALLGVAFVAASAGWTAFFDAKFREARRVVAAAGGNVYDGPRHSYHFFWHALWCGLGDFDHRYGHRWSDITAFSYAWGVLQQRHPYEPEGYPPVAADPSDVFTLGVYWDKGRQYARTPYEIPEYLEIIRDKVVGDVVRDPLWYGSILARRLARLVGESTPPTVALGNGWKLSLPGRAVWGYAALAIVLALLRKRRWFCLKLIGFTLPLAGTALVVYSGGGTPLYSVAHLVALAIAATAAAEVWISRGQPGKIAQEEPVPKGAWSRPVRWRVASGGAILLLLASVGWVVARQRVASAIASAPRGSAPRLAVLRFENRTSDERLAWIGDALAEGLAAEVARAGVKVLDPDRVDDLDADLLWWGPYGVPSVTSAEAVNVVADRSGAERVLSGRVEPGPDGVRACAQLFAAATRRAEGAERCETVAEGQFREGSRRMAEWLLGALGARPEAGRSAANADTETVRLYTEAQRAARRQMWGEASRLAAEAARGGGADAGARLLQARLKARWQPLDGETLRALTGAAGPRDALAALRARLSREPDSTALRVDLGRTLVALELYDEAEKALAPLRWEPGAPAEAFGLLAQSASSRGELDRAYLLLREYLRRAWREPRSDSLLAEHLLRWQDLDAASLALGNAESDRARRGAERTTLEDLVCAWRVRALRGEWRDAEPLAYQMTGLDDPRAAGVGSLYVATGLLFRGRSRLAGAFAEEAAFRLTRQGLDAAPALRMALEIRLAREDTRGALDLIAAARPTRMGDPRLAVLEAVAFARAGRRADAEAARERLEESLVHVPGPVARRSLHQLDGELALLRGGAQEAVRSFSRAERLLSARGFCGDHVPVWYGLARAHLAAKDAARAQAWLERVGAASYERLCWPIPYAGALAMLGRLRAAEGQDEEAGGSFEELLALWGEGDLAPADTLAARTFLQARRGAAAPLTAR